MNHYLISFIIIVLSAVLYRKLKKILKKKSSGYSINLIDKYREVAKNENKILVHCLHIGKTGGTAIKYAIGLKGQPYIDDKHIIIGHRHSFKLQDIKPGEKCFFVYRDPLDRFVSAFYSRKRKGAPRIYREWNKGEKLAFEQFSTPNELALALNDSNENIQKSAANAMNSIHHISSSYWDWFGDEEYLLSRKNDIIFIGNQRQLNNDFIKLKSILNLPDHLSMPTDPVKMHKNPDGVDKKLDEQAIENLKSWYTKDYAFLDVVEKIKSELNI